MIDLRLGDCLEVLKTIPDNSVDSIVTDPPYGISFMGKKWDYQVPSREIFEEILRVLKPGGHMLCACGTRTQHRMAVNIEDAGFEIRDVVTWLYGSGFPKSMDISKAIDKQYGAEREVIGYRDVGHEMNGGRFNQGGTDRVVAEITRPSTLEAKKWQGFGTALKPACEFWTLARKPLSEKTVASNVLKYGTGGINIDGCRIEVDPNDPNHRKPSVEWQTANEPSVTNFGSGGRPVDNLNHQGRFPANLILDEEAAKALDEQSGVSKSTSRARNNKPSMNNCLSGSNLGHVSHGHEDHGGASRFFYVAKASKSDRGNGNIHPTVKPIKLMQYLCRMITPPNGIVLDPFMGSGSTGVAAVKEGFGFIGIERDEKYFEICKARTGG